MGDGAVQCSVGHASTHFLAQLGAFDGHHGWADSLQAREILVANGLVDLPLAPQVRGQRANGDTVGQCRTVAAVFTQPGMDEDARGARARCPTLDASALLGGADLVEDERGHTRCHAQRALYRVQLATGVKAGVGGELPALGLPAIGVFRQNRYPGDTLCLDLPRDLGHGQAPVHRLPTGHGHRIVVQNLVGDVGLGGHGLANRQIA